MFKFKTLHSLAAPYLSHEVSWCSFPVASLQTWNIMLCCVWWTIIWAPGICWKHSYFTETALLHGFLFLGIVYTVQITWLHHVTQAMPLSGMIRRLPFDIAWKQTKFDDSSSFSRSRDISGVWNSRRRHVRPWPRPLREQLIICRLVGLLLLTKPCIKFDVCSCSRSEDILWGVKFQKLVTWPWPRSFHRRLVVRRLTVDIAYNRTKFDNCSFSQSGDI